MVQGDTLQGLVQIKSFVHLLKVTVGAVRAQFFRFTPLDLRVRHELFPERPVESFELFVCMTLSRHGCLCLRPVLCLSPIKILHELRQVAARFPQTGTMLTGFLRYLDHVAEIPAAHLNLPHDLPGAFLLIFELSPELHDLLLLVTLPDRVVGKRPCRLVGILLSGERCSTVLLQRAETSGGVFHFCGGARKGQLQRVHSLLNCCTLPLKFVLCGRISTQVPKCAAQRALHPLRLLLEAAHFHLLFVPGDEVNLCPLPVEA
mmetsp:Transcript_10786/g.25390  ORF Transcript_10786/g.25390 Transcript_10786/m.25390 type:complete len:261 (-) Transcript_10786:479-1261(-)